MLYNFLYLSLLLFIMYIAAIIKKVIGTGPDVGNQMHYLISTGNLASKSGLGLQQVCDYAYTKVTYSGTSK